MKARKIAAFLMSIICLLCFAGCEKAQNSSDTVSSKTEISDGRKIKDSITLLYSAADTFNPYTAKTDINRQLCKLLYEPLVKLDNQFNPVYSIAKSVKVKDKKCTVKLNTVKFSDKSSLSADDVVYSFKLAKTEGSVYSAELSVIEKAVAVDSKTVEFSLGKQDPYAANLLDFPIIKQNSDTVTDSDSVVQPPIGSGRYKVSKDRKSLAINKQFSGEKGSIKKINLINAPDMESVSHYVEVGAADIYYNDLSGGNIVRMSGQKLDINLNSLIYIGVNQNFGALGENALRQAISSGIDRTKICSNAYYNNAIAANGFFTPVWDEVKSVQNIQIEANSQITVENLEKIGYNELDKEGKRQNKSGAKLNFSLLVNSENRIKVQAAQIIAQQLSQYGITVTVVEKKYKDYIDALKDGDFQLFLGEIKLSDNMDISSMVLPKGSAAYGLKKVKKEDKAKDGEEEKKKEKKTEYEKNSCAEVVNGFYKGKNTITDIATVLQTEMPFIPVCYRTGALFCNDSIENIDISSASDIYFSIEKYNNYQ